jgi:predicted transcriptional regulator
MILPRQIRHLMWYVFAGTKGGATRIRIIELLQKRPYNAHQISKETGLDYRTILHHIKILLENQFILCEGKKYGEVFFLTEIFESEIETFNEILKKLGRNNK